MNWWQLKKRDVDLERELQSQGGVSRERHRSGPEVDPAACNFCRCTQCSSITYAIWNPHKVKSMDLQQKSR